jgi:hypothetical protein
MRAADDAHELAVAYSDYLVCQDPLTRAVTDRMLAGVSTRKFAVVGEPTGSGDRGVQQLDVEEAWRRRCSSS